MRIERPHGGMIRFRESRTGSFLFVVIVSAFILAWEWWVLRGPSSLEEIPRAFDESKAWWGPFFYILAGLPLPLALLVLRRLGVFLFGRVIAFDGLSRTITKNNRVLARFDEVDRVDLKKWDDGMVRAHLLLRSGKKIRIGTLCHERALEQTEKEILALLKTRPSPETSPSDAAKDLFVVLSISYHVFRASSLLLLLGSLLLLVVSILGLSEKLGISGNPWAASLLLLVLGAALYGASWFLKYLRLIRL